MKTPSHSLEDLGRVLTRFGCSAPPTCVQSWGDGHIHQTLKLSFGHAEHPPLLLQALNQSVFGDLEALMSNVVAVTDHGRAKLCAMGAKDVDRRMLNVLRAADGQPWVEHLGVAWRCYAFIEGASSLSSMQSEAQAHAVGRAFGGFIELLSDFDVDSLNVTLPGFHDTPARLEQLRAAAEEDAAGLRSSVQRELDFVEQRAEGLSFVQQGLASGELPWRVTHNDTKLNNVLMDDVSGKGACVIDLDTVMPGSSLYDFGDMLRTSVAEAAEDERELGRIHARADIFRGLVSGFTGALGPALSAAERDGLFASGPLITLEIGMRFLTDHLQGDAYYKVHRPAHNLDRARAQFALVRSLESQADELRRIVSSI